MLPNSAAELLLCNEDDLVELVNSNRTDEGCFDLSLVPGLCALSAVQKEELSKKVSSAATKAGPINVNELSKRLTETSRGAITQPQVHDGRAGSPTVSPPPCEGDRHFEAFCYKELLEIGGQPAILPSIEGNEKNDSRAIAPWLGDTRSDYGGNELPPVLSKQLEDWRSFQRWQCSKRNSDKGFRAYLVAERSRYHFGKETGVLRDPFFESTMQRVYKSESYHNDFAAYVQEAKKRLASRDFTQPFQLSEDPDQQNKWTTFVEYLNYVYWMRDQQAASMKRDYQPYCKAWRKLRSFDLSRSSSFAALKAEVSNFLGETKAYRQAEADCHCLELRAVWVMEQLATLKAETAKNDADGGSRKKRKRDSDRDDSVPKRNAARQRGVKAATSGRGVAGPAVPDAGPRRSRHPTTATQHGVARS